MTNETRTEYDLPTAVTFLLAGLALGALLAVLFSPPQDNDPLRWSPMTREGEEVLVE